MTKEEIVKELEKYHWYETDYNTFEQKQDKDDEYDYRWDMWFEKGCLRPVCQDQNYYKDLYLSFEEIDLFKKYYDLVLKEKYEVDQEDS